MIILRQEGLRGLYRDKRLKKLSLRFCKLIKKRYSYLKTYIDYEDEIELPILIVGVPDDLEIKDMKKFSGEMGALLEESGNLGEIGEMFLLAIEKIGSVEDRIIS
ncbi:unnamed protein product [marine sediment metagenome]|uniref:Uncharacterized protein n=1 Tax=marine sediment metagenome TaxID=412755 RepID=X1ARK6_9ZZZZ